MHCRGSGGTGARPHYTSALCAGYFPSMNEAKEGAGTSGRGEGEGLEKGWKAGRPTTSDTGIHISRQGKEIPSVPKRWMLVGGQRVAPAYPDREFHAA
jgi:hypothetical protein